MKRFNIPGYDGYQVAEDGTMFGQKGQRMNPACSGGYLWVQTYRAVGQRRMLKVHRAVALALLPNPENKECVNHKDLNKQNNHVTNLEWCTHSENMEHWHETK